MIQNNDTSLPYTPILNTNVKKPFIIHLTVFACITLVFLAFNLFIIGLILASIITFGTIKLEKQNNPGILNLWIEHWHTPMVLSGNKVKENQNE